MFGVLKQHSVRGVVLTPKGNAADFFESAGLDVVQVKGLTQFDNTKFGHYQKFRWLILLREFFYIPFSIMGLWGIRKSYSTFDLIHINEVTLLPVGILARWLFKIPVIFHIRSLQHHQGLISRCFFRLLNQYADVVICIDNTVKASLPDWVHAHVVRNGINLTEESVKNKTETLTIGMAGVLLRSKGVYEFVEAANILVNQRGHHVNFVLAGQNARKTKGLLGWIYKKLGFSEDVFGEVSEYIRLNNLTKHVKLIGLVKDIRSFYQKIDVLCFPSYLNACGRPVFEAALNGIPSVVAIKNPMEDALINGVTGWAIDKPDPVMIANVVEEIIKRPAVVTELGVQAKDWAKKHFDLKTNADLLLNIYMSQIKYKVSQ